jgi:hypothetical protein
MSDGLSDVVAMDKSSLLSSGLLPLGAMYCRSEVLRRGGMKVSSMNIN